MAAYLIGHIHVKDAELWQQYVSGVKLSLEPYEARIVFRGKLAAVLAGQDARELTVVIEFASLQALQNWFHADTYQSLIPLRDQAADVVITGYEVDDGG